MTGTDDNQQRLLRIIGRMPLASVENLTAVIDVAAPQLRQQLASLRNAGLVASTRRGMSENSQDRWFLTSQAIPSAYATDHTHLTPREGARAPRAARLRRDAGVPSAPGGAFTSDHEHLAHLEEPCLSPFDPPVTAGSTSTSLHEHPPWTATARGIRTCLRRLPMLEAVYRIAPDLMRNGSTIWPADGVPADAELRMTDFRLLRHGGFFHAVARYGEPIWVTFTYVGLHATERVLRRKQQHRFWGIDCYVAHQDRCFRIANRVFYEDPEQTVEPSAQVIVAADAWAADLARRTLVETAPTLICTADGRWRDAVEVRPSRDRVSDPPGHPQLGCVEDMQRWTSANFDLEAIEGPAAYRIFLTIAQFPAMRAAWLCELVHESAEAVDELLARFVDLGLVAEFDGRFYLAERGMLRAANLSRVLPTVIHSRHGALLESDYQQHEAAHNDGINRLVVQFAREGAAAFGGWRAEVNLPNITQVRPDFVVLVAEGPFGAGGYCVEYERNATTPSEVHRKLGPYRKCAWQGQPLPLLVVCETERAAYNFQNTIFGLPLLVTCFDAALAGPLTGDATVWVREGETVALHCREHVTLVSDAAQQTERTMDMSSAATQ